MMKLPGSVLLRVCCSMLRVCAISALSFITFCILATLTLFWLSWLHPNISNGLLDPDSRMIFYYWPWPLNIQNLPILIHLTNMWDAYIHTDIVGECVPRRSTGRHQNFHKTHCPKHIYPKAVHKLFIKNAIYGSSTEQLPKTVCLKPRFVNVPIVLGS